MLKSNFSYTYKNKDEKSQYFCFIFDYYFVNIQYIRDKKTNKFKSENIMKPNSSVR